MARAPQNGHYTRKQKLSVVMAADMLGVSVASEQAGIPYRTVGYWMNLPEFAEYRQRAHEDLAEEVGIVAHLAWQRVAEALRENRLDPRDALFAADKATTLYQLVTGEATNRTEMRDVTDSMSPVETLQLATDIEEWLKVER